jgi:phosphohistidine phosphatase
MRLYFLRHGTAAPRAGWDGDDALRPLTEQGQEEAARMAGLLARSAAAIDVIVTSPYLRASETADIVAQHLDLQDKVIADERLEPGFDAARLGKLLKDFPEADALLLVGHEPDFTITIGELTNGRVVLKKGGMAYVDTAAGSLKKAALVWLVQPSIVGA